MEYYNNYTDFYSIFVNMSTKQHIEDKIDLDYLYTLDNDQLKHIYIDYIQDKYECKDCHYYEKLLEESDTSSEEEYDDYIDEDIILDPNIIYYDSDSF